MFQSVLRVLQYGCASTSQGGEPGKRVSLMSETLSRIVSNPHLDSTDVNGRLCSERLHHYHRHPLASSTEGSNQALDPAQCVRGLIHVGNLMDCNEVA
jgi:hypothetical protein